MVNPVLERLYRDREVVHRNGRRKPLFPPGVNARRGQYLFDLVRQVKPEVTLEVGISTLFICEALRQNGRGRHIVIDPLEHSAFEGLGLTHLREAGLDGLVTFHEEPGEYCLPRLLQEGLQVDLAFDDSGHLFDHVVAETLFLSRLVKTGGLLLFEDATANAARGLVRRLFAAAIPPPPPLFRVFRKIADRDPRDWNDFTPF